jgi:HD-like signal output (HDOD) protein
MSDTWAQWVRTGAWLSTDGRNLPLMPGLMRDALSLGLDPDVKPIALIKRVSTEQQLAARVLQLANLAANAPLRAVTSVDEAVVRLGTRAVQRAVMAACIESWSQPNIYGPEGLSQMDHALGTACMAGLVAELAGADPDEAFAYGLLHDVGKLFLLKSRADYMRRGGAAPTQEELDQTVAECHATIGDTAMHLWGLPSALREPIRFHHTPFEAPTYSNEAAVAYVANRLSHRYGFGCAANRDESIVDDTVCSSIGVDEEWMTEMDGKAEPLFQAIRKGLH